MQIRTTLALAAAALTLGVPAAAAAPDGYQPQLQANAQPDVIDRYLGRNGPDGSQPQLFADRGTDVIDRYLANIRRSATAPVDQGEASGDGRQVGAALGAVLGAVAGTLVLLLLVGSAAVRGRRRVALR